MILIFLISAVGQLYCWSLNLSHVALVLKKMLDKFLRFWTFFLSMAGEDLVKVRAIQGKMELLLEKPVQRASMGSSVR